MAGGKSSEDLPAEPNAAPAGSDLAHGLGSRLWDLDAMVWIPGKKDCACAHSRMFVLHVCEPLLDSAVVTAIFCPLPAHPRSIVQNLSSLPA